MSDDNDSEMFINSETENKLQEATGDDWNVSPEVDAQVLDSQSPNAAVKDEGLTAEDVVAQEAAKAPEATEENSWDDPEEEEEEEEEKEGEGEAEPNETPNAEAGTDPEGIASEFTPDFTFKVKDQVHEFSDWIKPLVTDKESEEQARDIMTKVHGFDELKNSRDQYKSQAQELSNIAQEYNTIQEGLKEASHYANTGNFGAMFKKLGVSQESVKAYMDQQEYLQTVATPEEQQQYNQMTLQQQQNFQLQQRLQQQEQQNFQIQQNALNQEFESYMSNPQVSEAAQALNERLGNPNAFREQVANYAIGQLNTTGQPVGVAQAINHVVQLAGVSNQAQASTPMPGQAMVQNQAQNGYAYGGGHTSPQQAQQGMSVVQEKPSIPVIPSSGHSPIKAEVKSIDDLRKLAKTV